MKVERRFEAFPWMRERIPPISPKASIPELRETDDLQKLELDLQGAERRLNTMIEQGSMLLEGVWGDGSSMTFVPEKFRFNLSGLSAAIRSPIFRVEADPLITETIIEHPEFGQVGLTARWIICIFNCMCTVHACNTNPRMRELMMMKVDAMMREEDGEGEDDDDGEETEEGASCTIPRPRRGPGRPRKVFAASASQLSQDNTPPRPNSTISNK